MTSARRLLNDDRPIARYRRPPFADFKLWGANAFRIHPRSVWCSQTATDSPTNPPVGVTQEDGFGCLGRVGRAASLLPRSYARESLAGQNTHGPAGKREWSRA